MSGPLTSEEVAAVEAQFRRAAEHLAGRIATCHERVWCPKCRAPVGVCCRALPRGYVLGPRGVSGRVLKHPHRERWTQVVPER